MVDWMKMYTNRIVELEGQVAHLKVDTSILLKFQTCTFELQEELNYF